MTREGKWPLAAACAVVLATLLLAACGGSDSSSSDSSEASTDSTPSAQESGDRQERRGGPSQDDIQGQAGNQSQDEGQDGNQAQQGNGPHQGSSQDRQGGGGHPQNVSTPLKVSGGGSAQFRTKGGDNSIQEFGEESESELREVAEIVHEFYVARAEERWDAACSYMAKPNVEQLEKLGSQSPQLKGGGCGAVLKAFTRPLPASAEREITTVDAGSFRRDGEQGFLIYYGAGNTVFAMPLLEEGGTWKVSALAGTTLS